MNKGVSLISLVITVVVIIILAAVTVYNSLDTIDDANVAKMKKEYNDVCAYVTNVSAHANADMIDIEISNDMLASESQIASFYLSDSNTELTEADTDKIHATNEEIRENSKDAKYGYYYVTGNQIENGIPGIEISSELDGVTNNYIINFYYGVVIAKVSPTENVVTGVIK